MLWHQVSIEIEPPDDAVEAALAFAHQRAEHRFPATAAITFVITPDIRRGGWAVSEGDRPLATCDTPADVLDLVYRRVHERAFDLAVRRGWVRLHAATAELPVGRVLITGPSGAGKSTLACALLRRGVEVQGDESAMVRGTAAIPVARRFHLKHHGLCSLPDVAPIWHELPAVADGSIRAWDPTTSGFSWQIDERPVEAIVVVGERRAASLHPLPAIELAHELLAGAFADGQPIGELVGRAAKLADAVPAWRLSAADPDDAVELLLSMGGAS